MTNFTELFEYNAWANEQLLAITDELSSADLESPMPELGGSVLQLLDHTSLVEAAFLRLMTASGTVARPTGDRPYVEIRETFRANARGYASEVGGFEGRLNERFEVPWFERAFTFEQALTQVATHSVQHRAGVAAGIFRAGREAPDLDYIIWLFNHR